MLSEKSINHQRWMIFCVLALMYILVYFYRVSLAVVAGDITAELGLTHQQLGLLSGLLFYVYAVAQLPLGPMIDRLGGRLVISGCGILTATGGILFSQSNSLLSAMIARVFIGLGTASVLMATFTIFGHWYTKQEFGRVSGFMVAVGNLGNLAATAPLALAVGAIGWRSAFLTIGIVQIAATILVFTMVRDCPTPSQSPPESEGDDKGGSERTGLLAAWGEIFGNRDFWLLGIIAFFWYGNYLALQGLWGGPYLMEVLHLSRGETGKMLMFTSLGFISGSMVTDSIARRFFKSYKKMMLTGQLLLLILMAGFLGPVDHLPQPLLAVFFYAIGLAVSSGVMIYPIIRAMFRLEIVGTALTSLNFYVLMGAAMTQQIMGFIVGSFDRGTVAAASAYHTAFIFPISGLALAIVLFAFAHDYRDKP